MTAAESENMSSDQSETTIRPLKEPYQKPSLKVYGHITALTATVSNNSSHMDSGFGSTNKTH